MVEIEEVQEEKHHATTRSNEKDADGWEKLMDDDLVMKIIDKSQPAGTKDPESIQHEDSILIDFVGRTASDKNDDQGPIFQEVKNWMVTLGDGDVLPCVEMAIRFMQTGETSRVWSHSKFAFGPGIRNYKVNGDMKQVPPNASVMYEIKVTMVVLDTSRLNPYFTIQKATTRKSIANDIYQNEWCPPPKSENDPNCEMAINRALRLYTRAAKDMESLLDGTYFASVEKDHPQCHQTRQLMMDCLNNITAVYLRQHKYHKAKEAAIEVLRQEPTNMKGLLRAAKASLLDPASTLEEVEAALRAAEGEITYKNPSEEKQLKQLKAQFKRKRHEYKEKSKEMFGNKLKSKDAFAEDEGSNRHTEGEASAGATDESTETVTKSVSFDENSTKPPSEKGVHVNEKDEIAKDDTFSWKTQAFNFLLQMTIPLLLYQFILKIKNGWSAKGGLDETTTSENSGEI